MRKLKILILLAGGVALTSSAMFLKQGGFGAGHGDLDKPIFLLGLPWSVIPWPDFVTKSDFLWLIVLPFVLNMLSILLLAFLVRRLRRNGPPSRT